MIAYLDDFKLMLWITLLAIPMLLVMRPPKRSQPRCARAQRSPRVSNDDPSQTPPLVVGPRRAHRLAAVWSDPISLLRPPPAARDYSMTGDEPTPSQVSLGAHVAGPWWSGPRLADPGSHDRTSRWPEIQRWPSRRLIFPKQGRR